MTLTLLLLLVGVAADFRPGDFTVFLVGVDGTLDGGDSGFSELALTIVVK